MSRAGTYIFVFWLLSEDMGEYHSRLVERIVDVPYQSDGKFQAPALSPRRRCLLRRA